MGKPLGLQRGIISPGTLSARESQSKGLQLPSAAYSSARSCEEWLYWCSQLLVSLHYKMGALDPGTEDQVFPHVFSKKTFIFIFPMFPEWHSVREPQTVVVHILKILFTTYPFTLRWDEEVRTPNILTQVLLMIFGRSFHIITNWPGRMARRAPLRHT